MRNYVAEAVGTFALVFIGIGAIANNNTGDILVPAFAHGLTVMVMVFAVGAVSGCHINPAVSISLLLDGKISPVQTAGYVLSQLIGATLAALLAWPVFTYGAVALGSPVLNPGFNYGQAFICEFVGTFFLMLVIYGVAVAPKSVHPGAAIAIGMTVTAGIFLAGPISGAAFNPARSFGPALVAGLYGTDFLNQSVYWIGPLAGAIAATFLYSKVLQVPEHRPETTAVDIDGSHDD